MVEGIAEAKEDCIHRKIDDRRMIKCNSRSMSGTQQRDNRLVERLSSLFFRDFSMHVS